MFNVIFESAEMSGVDIAVVEEIGEVQEVFFDGVVRACKEMTEIMRKNFRRPMWDL